MRVAEAKRVRWTVKDYFRLTELGFFDRGPRVELVDGDFVLSPPQTHGHVTAVSRIARLLLNTVEPSRWVVIRGTLILSRNDAPDPDFHAFDAPVGTSDGRLPPPMFLIEVSDATYSRDSGLKLRTYARSGVGDYWIVNLNAERVEVYRQPENTTGKRSGWRYASVTHHTRGEVIHPSADPRLAFAVDAMLP